MSDEILDHPDMRDTAHQPSDTTEGNAEPLSQAVIAHARRPAEDPAVREMIVDFIVWNQGMEGIPSDRERVAAVYDEVLHDRESIFDP